MLSSSVRHVLKRSSRVAALCGQQLPPPATPPHRTRPFNRARSRTSSPGAAQEAKEEDASDLTFPTDVGFQGFPHLTRTRQKQEKRDQDNNDIQSTRSPPSSDGTTRGVEGKAGVAQDGQKGAAGESRTESGLCAGISEKDLEAQTTNASANASALGGAAREERYPTKGGFSHRQLRRRMQKPKRFRTLLQEVRRSGADHPRGLLDLNTGKPEKILSRKVLSTEVLEAELRWVARNAPAPRAVRNILRILLEERKTKPTLRHYEALILGQCHPEFGSIGNVKTILQEIEREGLPLDAPILLAALTVLAIHPDAHLRNRILDRLAKQQFALPNNYAHLNILALIREEQLEMATVELEKLSQKNQRSLIPTWLWTIYMHAICDLRKDFDALIQLLYRLSDSGFLFPRPTLLHLLLKASQAGDIHVTKFVWHGYVESMHIIPNEELCMSVLRVAAKEKDLNLAESVAIVLESVAGNEMTDPPALEYHEREPAREEHKRKSDSSGLPGVGGIGGVNERSRSENSSQTLSSDSPTGVLPNAEPTAISRPTSPSSDSELAVAAFSTPPALPNPALPPPPPRPLPREALDLLSSLGITDFDLEAVPTRHRRKRKPARGILYPLFREEMGLADARFDPRLALLKGWDWRKK
ncbi:hypothetical protein PV04_10545 [Phialophora macrospora]|uniref:Uncharacterized protein n=1 Tax=Phialophora macrospora TaxID=1851006 RepID=A0A0D2F5W1_9EURO|nr:hypothetical protein PV04_10545 [Phialophora macrospora]